MATEVEDKRGVAKKSYADLMAFTRSEPPLVSSGWAMIAASSGQLPSASSQPHVSDDNLEYSPISEIEELDGEDTEASDNDSPPLLPSVPKARPKAEIPKACSKLKIEAVVR